MIHFRKPSEQRRVARSQNRSGACERAHRSPVARVELSSSSSSMRVSWPARSVMPRTSAVERMPRPPSAHACASSSSRGRRGAAARRGVRPASRRREAPRPGSRGSRRTARSCSSETTPAPRRPTGADGVRRRAAAPEVRRSTCSGRRRGRNGAGARRAPRGRARACSRSTGRRCPWRRRRPCDEIDAGFGEADAREGRGRRGDEPATLLGVVGSSG